LQRCQRQTSCEAVLICEAVLNSGTLKYCRVEVDYNEDFRDFWFQVGGADYFSLATVVRKYRFADQGLPDEKFKQGDYRTKTMCPGLWRLAGLVSTTSSSSPLAGRFGECWLDQVARMRALGICDDTFVRSGYGAGGLGLFRQIPAAGFPEMKITFFQSGKKADRVRLLRTLANILEIE